MTASSLRTPRADWFYRSLLAGACATAGMLGMFYILYYLTVMVARSLNPAGLDLMARHSGYFTSGLAHDSLTALSNGGVWVGMLAHACIGMMLALAYGKFAEPRLPGHGWSKGLLFAMPLWLLSVAAFMPLMGISITALNVGFSFLLHATYGLLLGVLFGGVGDYRMSTDAAQTPGDVRESKVMERGAARGVLRGTVLGLVIAAFVHFVMGAKDLSILNYSVAWVYAATVAFCASMGFLVGMVTSTPGGRISTAG